MKRKMLREESELRKLVIRDDYFIPTTKTYNKEAYRLIAALVRAVREDCAKIIYTVEVDPKESTRDTFAAAIRGRK